MILICKLCSQNRDVNVSSPLIERTLSSFALTNFCSVLTIGRNEPCSTCVSMIQLEQRGSSYLQRIPEAHGCTLSNCGAQYHRQQQTALSPVPPAKRPPQNAHAPQDTAALPHRTCRRPNEILAPLKRGFTYTSFASQAREVSLMSEGHRMRGSI